VCGLIHLYDACLTDMVLLLLLIVGFGQSPSMELRAAGCQGFLCFKIFRGVLGVLVLLPVFQGFFRFRVYVFGIFCLLGIF
jgi:hypothetical protein